MILRSPAGTENVNCVMPPMDSRPPGT